MIVNLDKFQAIIIEKRKKDHSNENSIRLNLVGVIIDDSSSFNLHINIICRSSAGQLYALIRL